MYGHKGSLESQGSLFVKIVKWVAGILTLLYRRLTDLEFT
jgi:hypothetical protein